MVLTNSEANAPRHGRAVARTVDAEVGNLDQERGGIDRR